MNLQENILRIKEMMGVDKPKRPSKESFEQALMDIKPMIPELTHKIIHSKNLEHSDDMIIKINRELFDKVIEGNDDVLDKLWDIAGSRVLKNAINIITAYTK